MTALDSRPRSPGGTVYRTVARPVGRSLAVAGTLAVAQATFVSLVLVEAVGLTAWVLDPHAGADPAAPLRVAGSVWLTAVHTRVHAGAAVVGLPLPGLTLLLLWLLSRSVARVGRSRLDAGEVALTGVREAGRLALATALPLGVIGAVVAGLCRGPGITPSPRTALVGGVVIGAVGGLWGARRAWREVDPAPLLSHLPEVGQAGVRTALSAGALLGVVGGVLSGLTLALHHETALGLQRAVGAGVLGGLVLLLLQIALVPTVALCGVAWIAGPGFAVGSGSHVGPTGTTLGELPALPLLAALPGGTGGPGFGVVVVVVVIGAAAALACCRPLAALPLPRAAGVAAASGAGAALGLAVLMAFVGGPAGSGRFLTVGPSPWQVGLALLAELSGGCALGATLRWLAERER